VAGSTLLSCVPAIGTGAPLANDQRVLRPNTQFVHAPRMGEHALTYTVTVFVLKFDPPSVTVSVTGYAPGAGQLVLALCVLAEPGCRPGRSTRTCSRRRPQAS